MSSPIAAAAFPSDVSAEALLQTLLAIAPIGIVLLRPLYAEGDAATIVDFAHEQLNPAARQMLGGLPERPAESLRTLFPSEHEVGGFAFYRQAFLSGQAERYQQLYQADGYDGYYQVVAQRQGPLLLVTFTDTNEQPRSAVEQALRESKAREQAAHAEAERERTLLQDLLTQAPVAIALFQGPEARVASANEQMAALWGYAPEQVVGRPLLEGVPELRGQGFDDLLRQVLRTQTPVTGTEAPARMRRGGELRTTYYNFVYQPLRGADGQVVGVIDVAVEVTEQVLARRQLQALNEELAASNAEYAQANQALVAAQQQLRQLNQELEARVQQRTQDVQAALAEAERQRQMLGELVAQAPAALCIVTGPEFRYETFNPLYAAMFGGRPQVGQPMGEVLPEIVNHPGFLAIRAVYEEGRTFRQREVLVPLARPGDGALEDHYFSYTQQPRYDSQGRVDGVFVFAVEVTEQVQARQQVEQLNQQLEARVHERTRAALVLHADLLATTLKRADEREAFYQVFAQTTALVALLRGPAHRYEYVNPACQALFAGRRLVGLTMAEALPELTAQGLGALLDTVYQTGETFVGDELPLTLDSSPGQAPRLRYYNITYQAYREAGQVVGVTVFAFDVTAQVLARRELARQQQLVNTVFEQAPVPVFVATGPALVVEVANTSLAKLFNQPRAKLLGLPYAEAFPELLSQGFPELLREVWRSGQARTFTAMPVQLPSRPAGELSYYNFVYQPLLDAQGQVYGIAGVGSDVTEQVLARQQVEQLNQELEARVRQRTQEADAARRLAEVQRQRLEQLFMQAPAAICILDGPDLVYALVNAAYQQLVPGRALLGLPLLEALPELRDQPTWQAVRQVYRTGQSHQDLGMRVPLARTEGGPIEDFYFNYIQQARFDTEGQVDGVVAFAFDVTEQIRARQQVQSLNEQLTATNEELNESNAQLTRTNVDLDTFVYTASHDLRAPITNIEGLLTALRQELPAAVQEEAIISQLLGMMQGAVDRFQLTISQLSDISRLPQAPDQPAEPVALAAVVEAVRLDLLPLLASTQAQLTVEVGLDMTVRFSPKNLRSVVVNLLSNALKYHRPGLPPVVQLRAVRQAQQVALTVADNGLGMSETQQRQLFGLFQRLHTHVEGSGVGLYMVKRLVENAGGTIAVQSQEGVGSTFTVALPV